MGQQVVELGSNLQYPRWRVFGHNVICNLRDQSLPVWRRDWRLFVDLLAMNGQQAARAMAELR